jgi:hypothetical protein
MLSEQQRENIGRGVRIAAMRKRQSEAMKDSWKRRRANGSTPTPPPEQVDLDPFKCDRCPKAFHTAPALRMHQIRKHSGKDWDSSGNFKKTKPKSVPRVSVIFCPCCGCNIRNVETAIRFGERQ